MRRTLKHLWYLRLFDLPRDLSAAEIDAVVKRLDVRLEAHAKWLGIALAITVGAGGWVGGMFFNAQPTAWLMSFGFNHFIARCVGALFSSLVGCALGGLPVYLIALVLGRNAWISEARQAVREIGREVCVRCGYWLRGLNDEVTTCPECGTKREPMPEVLPEVEASATSAAEH